MKAIRGQIKGFEDVSSTLKLVSDNSSVAADKIRRRQDATRNLRNAFIEAGKGYTKSPQMVQDELRNLLGLSTIAEMMTALESASLAVAQTRLGACTAPVLAAPIIEKRLIAVFERRPAIDIEKLNVSMLEKSVAARSYMISQMKAQNINVADSGSRALDKHDIAANDVIGFFNSQMTRKLEELIYLARYVDEAYKNFSDAYRNAADQSNQRVAMIAMIAKAGLGRIPVVGAVIGAAAEAVITQFKHDKELASSAHNAFKPDQSHLSGLEKLGGELSTRIRAITRLGVSAERIQSANSLQDLLRASNQAVQAEAERYMRECMRIYFGYGEDADKRSQYGVSRAVVTMIKDPRFRPPPFPAQPPAPDRDLLTSIQVRVDDDKKGLKEAIMKLFGQAVVKDLQNFSRFVELSMWSRYFGELAAKAVFGSGGFPDKEDPSDGSGKVSFSELTFAQLKEVRLGIEQDVVKALERLQIVQHKRKGQHYADVIKYGPLPYDGNPVHDLGILLFFQWYSEINPFKIVGSDSLTEAKLDSLIKDSITTLGTAINASKSRSFFSRHSSIDSGTKVEVALNSVRASVKAA